MEIRQGQEVVGADPEEWAWRSRVLPPPQAEPLLLGGWTVTEEPTPNAAVTLAERDYLVVSVLREGQHQSWVDLLRGRSALGPVLDAAWEKSGRLQQRPQVQGRRKVWRTKRRGRTQPVTGTP